MSEPFGPFRAECDPVERIAQLRVLRTLVHVHRVSQVLEQELRQCESDWPEHSDWCMALIHALPSLTRRRILATFAYIHKPLYDSARKATEERNANAHLGKAIRQL